MPDDTGSGAVAPAATVGTAPAVVTPPASTTQVATPQPADENQPWFKERLSRAEKQARDGLLAELGVSDPAKAKAAIEAAAKAEEANKTAEQKRVEAEQKATALEQENTELRGAVQTVAASKMAALTEAQREAVIVLAGDDPHAQVIAIDAMTPTWSAKPAEKAAATTEKPKAASTAPAQTAPTATTTSPPDRKAEYTRLKASNPHAAAVYLNHYSSEIYPRA
jgi:hypothetical protein